MASTASSGWRSSATTAGWFQWGLGEEKGAVSCARSRQSTLGCQRGRRSCCEAGRRRASAHRCSAERRRCSGAAEWGIGERACGIECRGSPEAGARAKGGPGVLQRSLHGGVAVAAAWAALEAAGVRGTAGELQREATGGGGGAERRVGASAKRSNGRDGREDAPRRRRRRCRWAAARNRAGRWEKEIRVVLQFLKIPGTSL